MTRSHRIATSAIILSLALIAFSADEKPRGPGGGKDGRRKAGDALIEDLASLFCTDVPPHLLDVVHHAVAFSYTIGADGKPLPAGSPRKEAGTLDDLTGF